MLRRLPPHRTLSRRVALAAAATVSLALVGAAVFGSRGLLHLRALRSEEHAISRRIATLLVDNRRLRDRLQRLRTDDRYLERVARDQLGFVRPGEVVYRFRRPERQAPGAPLP